MITLSVMIKNNPWAKAGEKTIGNLLLVRKCAYDAHCDLEWVRTQFDVLGWVMFDSEGYAIDSDNGGACLNWAANSFDSIDVFYGRRYG